MLNGTYSATQVISGSLETPTTHGNRKCRSSATSQGTAALGNGSPLFSSLALKWNLPFVLTPGLCGGYLLWGMEL